MTLRPVLLLLACVLGCSARDHRRWRPMGGPGGVDFSVGVRSLPRETFGEVRHQGVYALGLILPIEHSPISFEINGSFSCDDDGFSDTPADLRARLWELGGGLRFTLGSRRSPILPYVSCGYTALYARIDDFEGDQILDDTTGAAYLRLGLNAMFDDGEYIGLAWRATTGADVDLFGTGDSADYHQFTLVFGAAW